MIEKQLYVHVQHQKIILNLNSRQIWGEEEVDGGWEEGNKELNSRQS
jgi:hypothetical protein